MMNECPECDEINTMMRKRGETFNRLETLEKITAHLSHLHLELYELTMGDDL